MVSSLLFVVAKTQHYMLVQFIERSFHFKMVSSLLFVVAKCQHSIEGQDIGDTIAAERDPPPSSQSHIAHRHFSDTGRYSNARAHTHTHTIHTHSLHSETPGGLAHTRTDRQTDKTDRHARTHAQSVWGFRTDYYFNIQSVHGVTTLTTITEAFNLCHHWVYWAYSLVLPRHYRPTYFFPFYATLPSPGIPLDI